MDRNPYESPRTGGNEQRWSNWRKIAFWSLLGYGSIFTLAAAFGLGCEIILAFARMRDPGNEMIRFKPGGLMAFAWCLGIGAPMLWGAARLRRKKP
jgi:hypothetical protein